MLPVESFEHAGFTVRIWCDDDADCCDPRQWDNLGTMVCWHRRYNLGDEQFKEGDSDRLKKIENRGGIVLPLYLFDHSGLRISTTCEHFRACDSAGWDWGKVGYIYVSKEKLKLEYGGAITQKRRETATRALVAEVEQYDTFLRGECYGYTILDAKGEVLDSVGGYLGDIDYVKAVAVDMAEFISEKQKELKDEQTASTS